MSARNMAPLHHSQMVLPPGILLLFFRFCSRCIDLSIDTGSRRRHFHIPLAQCFCLKYASQSVCGEFHVIFKCTALALIWALSSIYVGYKIRARIQVAQGHLCSGHVYGPLPVDF
jgi:hypothetical protein